MKRILFFIVGTGAGNATRNLAILAELQKKLPGIDIHIAAQGRALELLGTKFPTYPMREVTYAHDGEFSPLRIVTGNLSFPARFVQNQRFAASLIKELRPAMVVADSDFYCLAPARRAGVPLISINSSAATIAWLREHGIPPGAWFSARCIEGIDYWLQRRYPHQVVCPVLRRVDGLDPKFYQVAPIVRPQFLQPVDESAGVVVVTGGSGIGANAIDLRGVECPVVTFGSKLSNVPRQAEQFGFEIDNTDAMRRAKVLVIQGGFSSISEALALRKPAVIVPIPRHAEQIGNAQVAQEMGFGIVSDGANAGSKIAEVLHNYDSIKTRIAGLPAIENGAEQSASLLAGFLN